MAEYLGRKKKKRERDFCLFCLHEHYINVGTVSFHKVYRSMLLKLNMKETSTTIDFGCEELYVNYL